MKRWLVRICVFLLLGAIINVAVAWGFAIWAAETNVVSLGDAAVDLKLREAGVGKEFEHQLASEGSGIGVRRIVAAALTEDGSCGYHSIQAGIPFRAMFGELAIHDFSRRRTWALELSPRLSEAVSSFEPGILPLRPIWPGFAINTVFYAFVLWLLFAAPFALRRLRGGRRIKRGLCPKCAYPVGTNEVCTECGAAVPRKVETSTSPNVQSPHP